MLLQLVRTTYLQTLQAGLAGQACLVATIATTEGAGPAAAPDLAALAETLHQQPTGPTLIDHLFGLSFLTVRW